MLKKSLVIISLLLLATSSFAFIKGLDNPLASMVKVGESVTVPEGISVKSVVVVGGSATVYGEVKEDVVAVGGSIILKDTALVGGDVVAIGGKVLKEAGTIARGEIVEMSLGSMAPAFAFVSKGVGLREVALFSFLSFLGFLALVVLLVAFFTPQLGRISGSVEQNPVKNFLVGFLIVALILPITLLLVVSLVGIIFIPFWLLLLGVALIFGFVAASHLIGKKVLNLARLSGKPMMVEALVGVVLLGLVAFFPLIGPLVKIIASLSGLGAVYWTRFGTR
jgi:hypothetical protein